MIPVPTPSPKEMSEAGQYLWKKWQEWRTNRQLEAAKIGRQSPLLPGLLSQLYPGFERPWSDETYPVVVFRAPLSQVTRLETVLDPLIQRHVELDSALADAGNKYVELLQVIGSPLDNLTTYSLLEMKVGETITLQCALGNYFGALRTCDVLEWEILTFIAAQEVEAEVQSALRKLKYRSRVHSLSERPVTRPTGRNAAIAISTAIFFRRRDDYGVLVQRRSNRGVAVHGDLWHVAPSFMFQPVVDDVLNEYSVVHNVYREYLEELFRVPEVVKPPAVISYDYFYGDPNLSFLRSLLANGDAVLLFTGVAVNLLNLRPEICTLLHISSPEWFRKHSTGVDGVCRLELNEEWQSGLSVRPLSWISKGSPAPADAVPPGAAALWLALTTARDMQLAT